MSKASLARVYRKRGAGFSGGGPGGSFKSVVRVRHSHIKTVRSRQMRGFLR